MKLVLRLTTALAATGVLTFLIYAWLGAQREETELRTSAEREMTLLSRSLQVAMENALRDGQTPDVTETLTRLEQVEPDVDIGVHRPDGSVRAVSKGAAMQDTLEGKAVRDAMAMNHQVVIFAPNGGLERLVVAMPLHADSGALIGGLVLTRPLNGLVRDLQQTRESGFLASAVFAVIAIIVGLVLGRWLVGRPLSQLLNAIEKARGELDASARGPARLPTTRRDEVGTAAREFAALLTDLEHARSARERIETERRALERALEHADRLITVGHLSVRLAHEIGSPLQVLVGRAAAIRGLGVSDKVTNHATIIEQQGHRIVNVVRDFLSWARPSAPAPVPTSPLAEVRAIRNLLSLEARHQGIELRETIATDFPAGPIIACRPGQLQQVTFNLVKNALAATPRDGSVTIGLALSDDALILTVDDTGDGIPPEHVDRLFTPWFSTRLDEGGVGIGLSVVRGIVDDHHATITVESLPPRGTRFLVRWPLETSHA